MNDSPLPTVNVSVSVVFNILNAFNRRTEGASRIVGALLGDFKDNVVNVSVFLYHHIVIFIFKQIYSFLFL